ncbi:tumor necrosis factor receptor superfamily, member 5, isoform CRA_a [Rattus norvegicus]|uniref:Tumor necrosis factor receptor superfamily member 5 n=3 Tax=Rattus norvegicus TaxID=10116 RepID=A6JXD6_RAT|nr:tumor necrosis factor receptor superfamily member 5 precursor [Rattus norvegicus]AAH97949.1 CD40 molecule, TNF receptor superfamily member 5 [Rattus norvegicus]EDL96468.1 tumor necrosis factor receptor superfamily, member 5, isoform CRA_a [Rattus norvegicus]|eukprot:NP_599187.1 tumor necrosis factor receptor superfamily member 5 precursor [Rattus norvegicus]
MLPLPQLCALWGCLLTAVHLGQCVTCSDKQYLQGGECCDLCQPGNRLVSHCTALEKTQCQPCDSGEFSAHWNREIRCHQHRHCELNQGLQVKKEGTAVSDTVCTCKEGQHCASKECETCAQHTPCGPGFGVVQMATETTDTVCQPCPVGFFSNGSSLFEKCHPWTSCEDQKLMVLREGTSQTDTLCGFQPRMRALLVIPVVMVILITIFVVFLYIKKVVKKPKDNEVLPPEARGQDPVEIEDYPGHNTAAPVQETLHGCQPVAQEDGKESRISVQERQVTGSMALKPLV